MVENPTSDHRNEQHDGENINPVELVQSAHVIEKEEEIAHGVAVSEDIVQIITEVAVEFEKCWVLYVKDFYDLLSCLSVEIIIDLTPMLNHKRFEAIESYLESSRIGILLSRFQIIDMTHELLIVAFLLDLLFDLFFSEFLGFHFHVNHFFKLLFYFLVSFWVTGGVWFREAWFI